MASDRRTSLKRLSFRSLAFGLTVAAVTAIAALLKGSFDETEWRVIGTSVGFAFYSSLGAAGAAARVSERRAAPVLGALVAALSLVSFSLLTIGVWSADGGGEGLWRTYGCATIVALAAIHAALVLQVRSSDDGEGVRALISLSIFLGVVDAIGALGPITGVADTLDEGYAKLFGVSLVLLALTTALPPLLRRARRAGAAPAGPGGDLPTTFMAGGPRALSAASRADRDGALAAAAPRTLAAPSGPALAADLVATADRLEALCGELDGAAPAVLREVEQLRELARVLPR